jgi:hypothetical protein
LLHWLKMGWTISMAMKATSAHSTSFNPELGS